MKSSHELVLKPANHCFRKEKNMSFPVSVFILDVKSSSSFGGSDEKRLRELSAYLDQCVEWIRLWTKPLQIQVSHRRGDEIIFIGENYATAYTIAFYLTRIWRYSDNPPYFGLSFGDIDSSIEDINIETWLHPIVSNAYTASTSLKENDDDGYFLFKISPLHKTLWTPFEENLVWQMMDPFESIDIRNKCAHELGKMRSYRAISSLRRLLNDPLEDNVLRATAAWALGKIRDPAAIPELIRLLRDQDNEVRRAAAEALGEIRDPAAIPELIRLLEDEAIAVREAAAWALGEIGHPAAAPELIRLLQNKNLSVRKAAAQAQGKMNDPATTPKPIRLLRDQNNEVRKTAAQALGKIGDPAAIPKLIRLLEDEAIAVREAAARALGEIGDPAAVPKLIRLLRNQNNKVRRAAAQALEEMRDPAAVPELIRLLWDQDNEVRRAAARALGGIKDPSAVPDLIQLLQVEDGDVYRTAVQALTEIKDSAVLPEIPQRLQDKDNGGLLAATIALTDIGTDKGYYPFSETNSSMQELLFRLMRTNQSLMTVYMLNEKQVHREISLLYLIYFRNRGRQKEIARHLSLSGATVSHHLNERGIKPFIAAFLEMQAVLDDLQKINYGISFSDIERLNDSINHHTLEHIDAVLFPESSDNSSLGKSHDNIPDMGRQKKGPGPGHRGI